MPCASTVPARPLMLSNDGRVTVFLSSHPLLSMSAERRKTVTRPMESSAGCIARVVMMAMGKPRTWRASSEECKCRRLGKSAALHAFLCILRRFAPISFMFLVENFGGCVNSLDCKENFHQMLKTEVTAFPPVYKAELFYLSKRFL